MSLWAIPTAYVESAQTCGLHLLAPSERDPLRASSFGLGAPIVGDLVYGHGGEAMLLHAWRLKVVRAPKPAIEAEAPLPESFGAAGFRIDEDAIS